MIAQRRWIATMMVAAVQMCACSLGHAQKDNETRAASALFERFETVAFTDSRFLLNFKSDSQNDESLNGLRLPFVELIAGLTMLSQTAEDDFNNATNAMLVGAKDFRAPEGLGLVSSQKCYIGILADGLPGALASDMSKAAVASIEGQKVWTWSMPPYEGHPRSTPFYAAQVGNYYFVMGNNREEFMAIVHALSSPDTASFLLSNAFDWDNFSKHQYWACRLIRRGGVIDPEGAALTRLNSDAVAISFSADISKREAVIRVLSSDPDMKSAPRVLPGPQLQRFHQKPGRIWEATVSLTQDRAGSEAMAALFYSLGIGIAY